jgi:glutamate transport system ATP-binding protein
MADSGNLAGTGDQADAGGTGSGGPLVVLEDVNKWFGSLHVLKDINLTVHRGEVVVVIGPSGGGKSTLCRTINRLEPIDSGTIEIDGKVLPEEGKALAGLRADVGMVFQSFTSSRTRRSSRTSPSHPSRCAGRARPTPRSRASPSSNGWGSRTSATSTPPSSRVVSSSASPSPAHSR